MALRLCGNRADAEDMVQEVFLQAFRKWSTFRGGADPGTWLYAIATRSCKARLRRKGGVDQRMPAMSQLMPWNETTVMRIAAAAEGEVAPAERNEAVARVQLAITTLPEHLRVPLVMKEVLGASIKDVGAVLGLTGNTVKTRVHRARLALRKSMIADAATVRAPAPIYDKQVCLDLLKAKMEMLDRGQTAAAFKVPQGELCARCRAVFRELDLVHDACAEMSAGTLSASLRAAILKAIKARQARERELARPTRRGRPPVRESGAPSKAPGRVRGAASFSAHLEPRA